jgi:hypothetical protein
VASRFKDAEPLTDKSADSVATGLKNIYKRGPLKWPSLMQVDPGKEFFGVVNQLFAKHHVQVRRGEPNNHRQQGIVERFNRTLAEKLFGAQYAQEMLMEADERSSAWVRDLPEVIKALNDEPTRLTGISPAVAITKSKVTKKNSLPVRLDRAFGIHETILPSDSIVRYLYAPGELEGGSQRATDPIWSLSEHSIAEVVRQSGEPALYYLNDGPQRSFVREELQVIPEGTEDPPEHVLR